MSGLIQEEDITQIRDKANILDVISQTVALKKVGRTYKGLCPFHQEKTPSFVVDPIKQLYHCFGCGAGGDVFTFVMKAEGLDFAEAVESLARQVGHVVSYQHTDRKRDTKERLYAINSAAASYFSRCLMSPLGKAARDYLKSRGFNRAIAEKMSIGYAPENWDSLAKHLLAAGFRETEILAAGLASQGGRGKLCDRFRHRLIFPIYDVRGRIVAFGGRILAGGSPKYLNSPETPVYNKGATLYGIFQAKSAIVSQSSVIVVEGYTDVVTLKMAGVENAVATCGTAFTPEQLRLLAKLTDNIVLVFDGDAAGIGAAERVVEFLSHFRLPEAESLKDFVRDPKVSVRVLILPRELDPADYIVEFGAENFSRLVDAAKPFTDFYLERIIEKHDIRDPRDRRRAIDEALKFILSLASAVDQEEYLRQAADMLGVPLEPLQLDFRRIARQGRKNKSRKDEEIGTNISQTAAGLAEKEMLKLILQFPEKSVYLSELETDDWQDYRYNQLFTVLKSMQVGKGILDVKKVLYKLSEDDKNLVSALILEPILADDKERYFLNIFLRLKEISLDRKIKRLIKKLSESSDSQEADKLERQLLELQNRRREIKSQIV